jgi:large repetitive protein
VSYSAEVLADSPALYWKLDETSGTSATDSSGNSRTGTYGTATSGGTSLLGDGSGHSVALTESGSQHVTIASAAWMDVNSITVECLANLSSGTDGGNGDAIMSRYGGGGFNWLLWRNTTGHWAVQIRNNSGTAYNVAAAASVTLNTTYHLAFTFDGSNVVLYVNGSNVGSTAVTGTVQTGTEQLSVGWYSSSAATTPGGKVDEAAVYSTALSSSRISAHYSAAFPPPDATVNAVPATATAAAIAPAVSATFTASPPAATATAAAIAPAVTGTGDVTISAVPATATAAAPAPTLTADATVAGTAATATAAGVAPSVSLGATVDAVAATATAGAIAPTVSDGSGNRTVLAVPATATAAARPPAWSQVFPATTDTSNALNGRSRGGSATVTVTTPVTAPPATLVLTSKVDKAVAYPAPVMVNGRPT